MRKLVAGAALLCLVPLALLAQESVTPKAEMFTGVSYLRLEKSNQPGWDASLNGVINKNLGIVTDISGYYNSNNATRNGVQVNGSSSIHSILVGPKVTDA